MPLSRISRILCLSLLTIASAASAEVKLPAILASHMVLQRNMPIRIWGMAAPGEKVSVDFNGKSASTSADASGHWTVDLPAMKEGGPYDLHVKGTNTVTLSDILLGDVWIAAGQSNMGQTLHGWQEKDPSDHSDRTATDTSIRLFQAEKVTSEKPLDDVKAEIPWTPLSPTAVENFSALGYFFAKDIHSDEHVPIGVIAAAWGETTADIWINHDALAADPLLAHLVSTADPKVTRKGGKRPQPGGTYNSIIHPIQPLRIKGVIWYQGSNDTSPELAPLHGEVLKTLFSSWRKEWNEGDFPVIVAQIGPYPSGGQGVGWPPVREGQLEILKLPNTAVEVTTDTRPLSQLHDNHAVNKPMLGARMALGAEAIAYGRPIEYMGPIFDYTTADHVGESPALRVHFTHAKALVAPTGKLVEFEIAAKDGNFVPATATIDGSTVLVSSPKVSAPAFVRYEWVAVPSTALYNGDKLPASPFNSQLKFPK